MDQLDIFADSRDVMLRNDVLERLQQRDAPPARAALERLTGDYPADDALPALALLVHALESESDAPLANHESLARTHHVLANEVVPAAQRVLPRQAVQTWLAPLWRSLARRAAALPFRGAAEDWHAAPMWLRAGDWESARTCVEDIESWWRIPAPLAWMTQARYRSDGLDAAWPLLAELAWLSPARFATLLSVLDDTSLDALRRRFEAGFTDTGDIGDFMWFPALRARGKQWTPVGALKILGSAVCEVSIRLAEKVDRTTIGVSIFRRKFRMVGSPIRQGFRLC